MEFAALDSVPPELVDNAAILGTLSLITAALFLLDLGGPKAKKLPHRIEVVQKQIGKRDTRNGRGDQYEIEAEIERRRKGKIESGNDKKDKKEKIGRDDDVDRGRDETDEKHVHVQNGYTKMKEKEDKPKLEKSKLDKQKLEKQKLEKLKFEKPTLEKKVPAKPKFGIYGKDEDDKDSDTDLFEESSSKTELHSPVWSNIRKGN